MTRTEPWDDPRDIADAVRRIASDDASGLVVHDEGMDTRYSDFDRIDDTRVRVLDELLGRHRILSLHELHSMFASGDAFIVGGRGEKRFEAARSTRSASPRNPFGSRSAVIATARRIANERGEPIDERLIEALSEVSEAELLEAVLRYVSEPDYALDSDLPLQLSPLN